MLGSGAWAEEGAGAEAGSDEGLEITGLILDETKTRIGRDFLELFQSSWQEVPGLQYTIRISELPDGMRGTFVWVYVNDTVVYGKRTEPRLDWLESEARAASAAAALFLLRQLETDRLLEEEGEFPY